MDGNQIGFLRSLQLALVSPRVRQALLRPRTRYVISWLAAAVAVTIVFVSAWYSQEDPARHDYGPGKGGNFGHATIDFGGQWLMGRMLAEGHGRQLYNRAYQREVLRRAYPPEHEAPHPETAPGEEESKGDVENLMYWLMGQDNRFAAETAGSFVTPLAAGDSLGVAILVATGQKEWTPERLAKVLEPQIGGPLYPPVNGYFFYPLALLEPLTAYRTHQIFDLFLWLLAGFGVRLASQGRIWWPVGVTLLALVPGFLPSVQLGQNALLTLNILLWGWVLLQRNCDVAAGVVWGLLAFKPVWALAFFLVPLLSGRWRLCVAMLVTGAALAASTLPVVGVGSWRHWLQVGKDASELYDRDENWVILSRDLLGIPRRFLLDFRKNAPVREPHPLAASLIGWGLLLAVIEMTVRLAVQRRSEARAGTGPVPAFLLLSAWMSCYHFMYYDVSLAALPLILLLADFRPYLKRRYVALQFLATEAVGEEMDRYYEPQLPTESPPATLAMVARGCNIWVVNGVTPTLVAAFVLVGLMPAIGLRSYKDFPLDTVQLLIIWLWCGWLWMRRWHLPSPEPASPFRSHTAPRVLETAGQVPY